MKLFGKELFSFKKEAGQMYDFAMHGLVEQHYGLESMAQFELSTSDKPKKAKKVKKEKLVTPKELYAMNSLNDNNFAIKHEAAYIEEQVQNIDEKLALIAQKKSNSKRRNNDGWDGPEVAFEPGGVRFGRMELESMRERLLNRYRLDEFKDILEEYPHTSSDLISNVVNENRHLRCQKADEFVPDFPKDAVDAMKKYNDMCVKLFNKKSVFYVIADRGDFEKKNQRRDPILLAQSPFGHFWQVLGAWDEEMVYLADL